MTDDPIYSRLRETSWRRKLTSAEEAELRTWLEAHPEAWADWQAEAELEAALGRLPDAPVAGNFTARVLRTVEREGAAASRRLEWRLWPRLRWLPKAAFVATAVGLVSYHVIRAEERRKMFESVEIVTALVDVSPLRSPEILEKLAAIPEILQVLKAVRGPNPAPTGLLPPPPEWPISLLDDLLKLNPARRAQALTNYPPAVQAQIRAELDEYESLPPDDRKLRLRMMELRSYLRPLLGTPVTNRAPQLAGIPEADRKLVEDRLREWDKLAPEAQKVLLENEAALSYLAQIEGRTEEQWVGVLTNIPPGRRAVLENGVNKLNSMSEDQRWRTLDRFNRFFKLTAEERDKALRTLSEPERQQINETLRTFENMRPERRVACIRSLAKFTSLGLPELLQFFSDVERWQQLSPAERQAWLELVRKVPPPPPMRWPPVPPRPPPPAPPVPTNSN